MRKRVNRGTRAPNALLQPWSLALLCLLTAFGCTGPSQGGTVAHNLASGDASNLSPEIASIDKDLQSLEARAARLRERVDRSQSTVADKMVPEELLALRSGMTGGRTYMEISRNGLLKVNGITMSREDFKMYTEKQSSKLCQPTPILVVDPQADYDLVAWTLERVYAQNCASVDITEQAPGSIAHSEH